MDTIFNNLESNVQCYGRSFPTTFNTAKNAKLIDSDGKEYIDFLAGAGTLNYGHNHDELQKSLIQYIEQNGICHGLDMYTEAKASFLNAFNDYILKPRQLDYKIQFTGPTGANAVEAALKLARLVTKRENIIAFTNGFHGVTLGALAATGNQHHRKGAGIALSGVTRIPFDGYHPGLDSAELLHKMLTDNSSGVDLPAAILLETLQGEGGLNVASNQWLRKIESICRELDILLIVDDIQAGCGRIGTFFSFEESGIKPDIVTLSKSLSGYGLPMAITLFKPEHDIWQPGEHNGTFRGNNLAFVTATKTIETFWRNDDFAKAIKEKSEYLANNLRSIARKHGKHSIKLKGRGMMIGLEFPNGEITSRITEIAFSKGVIIESSGPNGEVLKCLAPLTIPMDELSSGLSIIEESIEIALQELVGLTG